MHCTAVMCCNQVAAANAGGLGDVTMYAITLQDNLASSLRSLLLQVTQCNPCQVHQVNEPDCLET